MEKEIFTKDDLEILEKLEKSQPEVDIDPVFKTDLDNKITLKIMEIKNNKTAKKQSFLSDSFFFKNPVLSLGSLAALLLILGLSITYKPTQLTPTAKPGEPAILQESSVREKKSVSPVDVNIEFSSAPSINNPVDVIFTVRPWQDAPDYLLQNTRVKFSIPDDFDVVSGETEWQGSLVKNEIKKFILTVRPEETGVYEIVGGVEFFQEGVKYPVEAKTDVVAMKISEIGIETTKSVKILNQWEREVNKK